jgi:light-regulated signal transduction histidine kinase (bacteriophytochrome)
MSALIQSLLDYSHLSQEENTNKPVDLNGVLKLVLGDLELLISEKNCEVSAT